MSKKLTPWFPADVKPVRVGVYKARLTKNPEVSGFGFWDGRRWGWLHNTEQRAMTDDLEGSSQNKEWRGLASDPKAK